MIERLATFAREVDDDINSDAVKPFSHDEFRSAGINEMMKRYGISYGAYHRLKVGEATTFLTEVIARAKGHDPSSDAGTAIRLVVAAWRRHRYKADRGDHETE